MAYDHVVDGFDREKKRQFKKDYNATLKDLYGIYIYKYGSEGICSYKELFYYCYKHQRENKIFDIIGYLSSKRHKN